MNALFTIAMANNAALLLVSFVVFEFSYLVPEKHRLLRPYLSGVLIAMICIVIMSVPFTLIPGVVFDTRSILISVTALTFGPIPAAITVAAAAIYRVNIGGDGTLAGLAVIASSALIGLMWRQFVTAKPGKLRLIKTYAMSVIVHIVMLACMLLLPSPAKWTVIREITLPVMLVFPMASLVLSMLLMQQQEHRGIQELLKQSEERFQLLFTKAPLGYQSLDANGCFIEVNQQWLDTLGYERDEVIGKWFGDFLAPDYRDSFKKRFPIFKEKGQIHSEFEMLQKSGRPIYIAFEGKIGYGEDGAFKQTHCILQDITDKKKAENELYFLSFHDYLTGFYNRRYFDEEIRRLDIESELPLSIILGDIDGLKLINDAFGHAEGDKLISETAKNIQQCIAEKGVLARIGGDEFGILLPKTDAAAAYSILQEIKQTFVAYNANVDSEAFQIHISLGFGTKTSMAEDFAQINKVAENHMYQRKLLESKSSHSALISSIKATMHEKSFETEAHAERMVYLSRKVGMILGLSQTDIDHLELLATLHDLGKVGISDQILNKPGKLNDEDWVEMKKHPEIGYRIASSSPNLIPIADCILSHHERWDGKGYPQGLSGEDIPLLSRIISIADAFDAMTQDRPYRMAMTNEQAMIELQKYAGTQFDPRIVQIFLETIPYKLTSLFS